jgi:hypothetical protein
MEKISTREVSRSSFGEIYCTEMNESGSKQKYLQGTLFKMGFKKVVPTIFLNASM